MRKVFATLVIVLASLLPWQGKNVEADENLKCHSVWPHKVGTAIDYATVLCWAGHGHFEIYAVCYWPTWVIDNGVVVDVIKHYDGRYGPPQYKRRERYEDNEVARVNCDSKYYIMETVVAGLTPSVIKW